MKKVIKGRRYDTSTAKKVGEYEYSNPGDFNYVCEELYRKQTGEFFIHGEGGPRTQYAITVSQNCWSGGEKITPLTYKEAQEWAEKYLDGEDYEAIFGEIDEAAEKNTVALRLSPAAVARLKKLAAEQKKPMSEIVEALIMSGK